MRSAISTPFAAVFQNEVLFNLKRAAPYALAIIFSANAVMWWGWGAAVPNGWATNSEFYIVRNFKAFSFITGLPLFIALMMGDPVVRDFRIGVDPLIFSKPISRAEYLLGKFFGNFFVLVCCQACFALTLLLLQAFSTKGMIVLPPRVLPYFQHFFFFVVLSSLAIAAVCFTVGTLTRNVKIVYGLVLASYFLYIAWQETIKGLPLRWRVVLDPLLFNGGYDAWQRSADWLNHVAVGYDGGMIANRLLMVAVSLLCLTILYLRFSTTERAGAGARREQTSILDLTPKPERLYGEAESESLHGEAEGERLHSEVESAGPSRTRQAAGTVPAQHAALPRVNLLTRGWRAGFEQFKAALGAEFRLLRAERGLVVVAPLVVFMCGLELAGYKSAPGVSYSAGYAASAANVLLLFLFGIALFYAGEAIHRDRELRVEPLLWSAPAPNFVLLLSKFSATLLLSSGLSALVTLTAVGLQIYKGHAPLELQTYLATYALILVPTEVFMIAASVALNVLLRDKYLTYALSLAVVGGIYYLISQGYNHPLYNPALYQLWTPSDLSDGGGHLTRILIQRVYCLALSAFLLALALLFFERKPEKGLRARGRLSGTGWAFLVALASALTALVTGLMVGKAAWPPAAQF
ncbi:MAG: ABC transporter permease [Acidobacteriota bacterium]|nr:ABC transporter permease [Acidobacteriota bacterium]MDQ5837043.1 ABC transporter permease [Acidobacteriota bacterium]